jgi:hypothetical protein
VSKVFSETADIITPGRSTQLDEEQEEGFCSFNRPRPLWTEVDEVVERVAAILAGPG